MILPWARLVFIFAFVASLVHATQFVDGSWYSVVCSAPSLRASQSSKTCEIVQGQLDGALASGFYKEEVNKDGWGKLFVRTPDVRSVDMWYAAGYLEGAFTSHRIWQHFQGWYDYTFGTTPMTPELQAFIEEQYKFATDLAQQHMKDGDVYYQRLAGVLAQVEGIYAGMTQFAEGTEVLDKFQLLLLEAAGDVYDIIPATTPSAKSRWTGLTAEQFRDEFHRMVSCSALIKIADDLSDVFAGHTTWTSYQNMLRVWKQYEFGTYKVSFSAKPGVVYSKDDFYVVGAEHQKLVVMETTNGVLNDALYDLITPRSLLTWQRIPMTNSLARNGQEWTTIYARYNSGTYNNQYMVVDMKQFVPGEGAKPGFLWIIEQIPGMAPAADVTEVMVGQGNYWPSYNVPYFKSVYVVSGFQAAYEQYGDSYSYENCVRAQMFARDQAGVQSLESIENILRYNDYQNDPLAKNDPMNAISPRKDLEPTKAKTFGGIDSKVSSYSLVQKNVAAGQSGPTHDQQPVFTWANWPNVIHPGMPETYDFPWVTLTFGYQ